ncbi:MAG: sugar phosphate nucleotidyltransferase, partial [Candidatus Saccharimonadales bacterium]
STPDKPKHLMKINGDRSLLQDAYARAAMFSGNVYVVTNKSHSKLVTEQLKDELDESHIIVEPERRGTASAITLALAKLSVEYGQDEVVGFIHADHNIADKEAFKSAVVQAGEVASSSGTIALIGINPDYPATGFGYIKKAQKLAKDVFKVAAFEEKPDAATAEGYVMSGQYLWNLGLFAGNISTFIAEMSMNSKDLFKAYEDLRSAIAANKDYGDIYKAMVNQPIEPVLIEKTDKLVVLRGGFDWMDIGSYKDLHEALPKSDTHGNAIDGQVVTIDTTESIVIEQTGRPVAVLGLDNVAVISTDKGILICHKEYSQRVKEVAEAFKSKE